MIDRDIINKILLSIDPLSIAMQYVSFKSQGKRYVALCPFHKEKTPSFFMNEEGIFHCFGCGKGGNFITFIMEIEKLSFIEAVHFLADKAGIKIDKSLSTEALRQKEILIDIHKEAAKLFHEFLFSSEGEEALRYLANRQITEDTIKKFQLGYAPNSWEFLVKSLGKKFELPLVAKSGLIIANEAGDGYYDRFRNRIMIPIYDSQDNIVAFGGRALTNDVAKYINSAESPIFQKSNLLFALNLAKKTLSDKGYAILVEGYFDAISLHSEGFDNTVASLGTSLTEQQINILKRYTSNIYLCYDSDTAGKKATDRAILMLLKNDFSIKIIVLNEGEDPDSFCRKYGKDAFEERLNQASDYITFFFSNKISSHQRLTPKIKSSIVQEGIPLLEAISNPIIHSHYVKTVAELLKIKEEVLVDTLQNYKLRGPSQKLVIDELTNISIAEKVLLLACINEPSFLKSILIHDTEELFEGLATSSIFEKLIQMFRNDEQINISTLMLKLGDEDKNILSSILLENLDWQNKDIIAKSRAILKTQIIERKLAVLDEKIKNLPPDYTNDVNDLLQQKEKLQRERLYLISKSK